MAYSTTVGRRIHEGLVFINDEACTKTTARKATTCVHSRKPIKPGDDVYRPFNNSSTRSARYLAAEIEAIEANRNAERADPFYGMIFPRIARREGGL